MNKGYYLVWGDDINDTSIGENRKILGQIKAFNDNGILCDIVSLPIRRESRLTKILTRLPFSNCVPVWKHKNIPDTASFLYMRRPPFFNYYMYKTLRTLRKSGTQILMEIPTFPYDKEIVYRNDKLPINYPLLWKDQVWRKLLYRCVDAIVTPADIGSELWRCKVLQISNGIVLDDYIIRKPINDDTIDLIAVAMFKEWHGYERIINALHQYQRTGSRRIKLHMVGGGTEIDYYKKLVSEYGLEEKVIFYGKKTMAEIDCLYDVADIGLCSFGAYKKDLYLSKELKSREYLAKGLPIVSGCELDVLKEGDYGYLLFPNNESSIEMQTIIEFYDTLYSETSKTDVAKAMREIAKKKCQMADSMQSVINYLKRAVNEQ